MSIRYPLILLGLVAAQWPQIAPAQARRTAPPQERLSGQYFFLVLDISHAGIG